MKEREGWGPRRRRRRKGVEEKVNVSRMVMQQVWALYVVLIVVLHFLILLTWPIWPDIFVFALSPFSVHFCS